MADLKIIKRTVALDGGSVTDPSPNSFFDGEQGAHTFIIAAVRGGQPLMLSGAVSATFLNPHDAVVSVTGSIVDGAAVVTLKNECYALSGRFTLTIDVNGATVYECQSLIKRRSSGTAYDPSGEISVATLSALIAEMRTATAMANAAAATANAAAEASNALKDVVYNHDSLLQNAIAAPMSTSVSGWRLNESNGLCSSNSSYQLKKYAVTPGDEVKVVSDDRFQFQSSSSVPSTGTSNRVGETTYQAGEYHLIVPVGASWLIVSTPASGSTAQVYLYTDRISDLAENTNSNLILLPDVSSPGSGITTFKKVGHEVTAVGTATATKMLVLYSNTSAFPEGIDPGGEYYISLKTQNIKFQIMGYLEGSSTAVYFLSGCYSSCKLKVPENAVGIIIRFNVPNGTTVNETAIFSISKWPGNDLLLGYGESAYLFDPTRNHLHDIYTNFKPGYYNESNVYSELPNAIISEILGPFSEPITIQITNSDAKYYIYPYTANDTRETLEITALTEQITIPRGIKFRVGIRLNSGIVRDIFGLASCVWAPTKTYDPIWVLDPFRKADGATHLNVKTSNVDITASNLQMALSRLAWWFTAEKTIIVRSSLLDFKVRVYNASTNQISQSAAHGDAWLKTATLEPGNYYIYAALASNHDQSISIADYGNDLTSRDLEIMAASSYQDMTRLNAMSYPALAEICPFEKKALTYSSNPIAYGSNTTVRRSLISDFSVPVVLNMYHPDYVFRVVYYDGSGNQHATGWAVVAHVPAANNVGITVKCRTDRAFADDEMPHLWMYPVDYCDKPKSYFESEIADTIAKVKKYRTEPGLCLFVSTDQHNMSVQGTLVKQDTVTDMANNMRAVIKSVRPDAHVALGDLTDYKWNNNTVIRDTYGLIADTADQADQIFFDWMTYSYERLLNVFDTFLYIPGNHDDNRYINRDRLQETVSKYDYTPGEVYAYYLANSHTGRVSNQDNNGMDYYVDWPSTKIRVICLDANYYNPESAPASTYTYKDAWWYGFSNQTAPWLSGVLSATPSDYSVLILTHMSPVTANNADNVEYMNFSRVKSAILNFVNGGGKLIGEIYGHSHIDWMTTSPWVDVTLNCQKCINTSATYPNMPGLVHPTRTVSTASEDCWNIVLVKPISGRLDIIRFGAGNDRFIHYKDLALSGSITVTSLFDSVASWASNNTAVATVSNGTISPVAAGRAMITATNSSGDTEHWSVVVS